MTSERVNLWLIVPAGFDDPARPSGGNRYDRRVGAALGELGGTETGWQVRFVPVDGPWPQYDAAAHAALAREVDALPDGGVVLVDGLVASGAADVLVARSSRLRLVILVHTLLAGSGVAGVPADIDASEAAVLAAAHTVVTTSSWTRRRVLQRHPVDPDRVRIVRPGVVPAQLTPGTARGDSLLCVANLLWHKGPDVLIAALSRLTELDWRCVCAGATDQDPALVSSVRERIDDAGISRRICFTGPLDAVALDRAYAAADVLVVPSRFESYGMVVGEALARGIPVIGSAVGGVSEALGRTVDGRRPGRLIAPDDPAALAAALRDWLQDQAVRTQLRAAARDRRATLRDWSDAARDLSVALGPLAVG